MVDQALQQMPQDTAAPETSSAQQPTAPLSVAQSVSLPYRVFNPQDRSWYEVPLDRLESTLSAGGILEPGKSVPIINPRDGGMYEAPADRVPSLLQAGGRIASLKDYHVANYMQNEYSPGVSELGTTLENAANTASFGLYKKYLLTPSQQDNFNTRQEANPISAGVGKVAGVAALPLIGEATGATAALGGALEAGAGALGAGETIAGAASTLGTGATQGVVGGMQTRGAEGAPVFDVEGMARDAAFGGVTAGLLSGAGSVASQYAQSVRDLGVAGPIGQRVLGKLATALEEPGKLSSGQLQETEAAYERLLQASSVLEPPYSQFAQSAFSPEKLSELSKDGWSVLQQAAKTANYTGLSQFAKSLPGTFVKDVTTLKPEDFMYLYYGGVHGYLRRKVWTASMSAYDALPQETKDAFTMALYNQVQRADNYLNSKALQLMPSTMIPAFTQTSERSVDPESLSTMTKYQTAALTPMKAVEDMREGVVYPEYVDALQTLHPENWQKAQADLIQHYNEKYLDQGYLTTEDQMNFYQIAGAPFTPDYSPYMLNNVNALYQQGPQGPQAPQGSNQPKQQSRSRVLAAQAGKSEMADDMMTDSDRASYAGTRRLK